MNDDQLASEVLALLQRHGDELLGALRDTGREAVADDLEALMVVSAKGGE